MRLMITAAMIQPLVRVAGDERPYDILTGCNVQQGNDGERQREA